MTTDTSLRNDELVREPFIMDDETDTGGEGAEAGDEDDGDDDEEPETL